ncbi:hypothetical protein BDV28DRAFT_35242 [Aspergillus coremiiformis]|uniref:Uncharacterized protein n=1 Tax=Aspergillus coremiiformis TaxID=138285 RepID=A0A5N6Z3S2_9EURO|nr:hypothetical protein BDV28DRAFT_35242 [Aspergillus coremiiformis]
MRCQSERTKAEGEDDQLELAMKSAAGIDHGRLRMVSGIQCWWTLVLGASLFISLTLNLWWIILLKSKPDMPSKEAKSCSCSTPDAQRSPYTGLAFDVPTRYSLQNEYISFNKTHADHMWETLNLDGMVIAPTVDWARNRGLPDSWDFPWDANRKIYFLKVFHQLHCLKRMRKSFHQLWSQQESTEPPGHIEHCLDSLRQDLICKADDTPMPSLEAVDGAGEGQIVQCKDFERLMAWTKHPDRNACYKRLNEDYPGLLSIERYAFCPPESEHFAAMSLYFEKHGHTADLLAALAK